MKPSEIFMGLRNVNKNDMEENKNQVIKRLSEFAAIQDLLYGITEDNVDEVYESVINSSYSTDFKHAKVIVDAIFEIIPFRPKAAQSFCDLLSKLSSTPESPFDQVKTLVQNQLMKIPNKGIYASRSWGTFRLIYNCLTQFLMTKAEIVNQIKAFHEYYPSNIEHLLFIFAWFVPEIEEFDQELYNEIIQIGKENQETLSDILLTKFLKDLPKLKEDDWNLYYDLVVGTYEPNSIGDALMNDNVELLQHLSSEYGFEINGKLQPALFSQIPVIQSKPTYICAAAFFGSVKCFKFLMMNHANLEIEDDMNLHLPDFAVIGGSSEIVRILDQEKISMAKSSGLAISFHQNEIFQWIVTSSPDQGEIQRVNHNFDSDDDDVDDNENQKEQYFTLAILNNNISMMLSFYSEGKFDNPTGVEIYGPFAESVNHFQSARFILSILDNSVVRKLKKATPGLIYKAVAKNQSKVVKMLIKRGFDSNKIEATNDTPLIHACLNGDLECVRALFEDKNLDINLTGDSLQTPLATASFHGFSHIVQLFKSRQDVDINIKNIEHMNPLHLAARNGHYSVVQQLLQFPNINVNTIGSKMSKTALHYAAENGHHRVIKVLLEVKDIDVNALASGGMTPLICAACSKSGESVSLLALNPKIDVNLYAYNSHLSALHYACKHGNYEGVKVLINTPGINLNALSAHKWTPLHFAAENGFVEILGLLVGCQEINLNAQDIDGKSPLHLAAQSGNEKAISVFIKLPSIDVNIKDKSGKTPLHYASQHDNSNCVKMLLECSTIDVNCQDETGKTPLHYASQKDNFYVIRYLLHDPRIEINKQTNQKWMAIHFAADNGNDDALLLLLPFVEDNINAQTNDGYTPLHLAAAHRHTDAVRVLLGEKNINVNVKNIIGKTPLHFAATTGFSDVVKLLLGHKDIDIHAKTNNGQTPADLANKYARYEVAAMLK